MEKSWRTQTMVLTETANTIADGIAIRVPILEAVNDMQGLVDQVLLVNDSHIVQAMKLVYEHTGFQLEPSGAVGVAAILAHRTNFLNKRVATVLCGSNVTAAQFLTYVA
jgi:threonine dehydratase